MKILVAFFLLSALGLAFAKSLFPKDINKEFIEKLNMLPTESEEESALKQTVVSSENDQDTEDWRQSMVMKTLLPFREFSMC